MAALKVCFLYVLATTQYVVSTQHESNGSIVRSSINQMAHRAPDLPNLQHSNSKNTRNFSELERHPAVYSSREVNLSQNGVAYKADNTECPPWWQYTRVYENGSIGNACKCGHTLKGVVKCTPSYNHYRTSLLPCFCMTYSKAYPNRTVVGSCLYACFREEPYYDLPAKTSELSKIVCGELNRDGQLCGRCREGYAPPVYSYSPTCIKCTECSYNNWVKYSGIVFAPITVFFGITIVFRVSVVSPMLNAFVLVCQVAAFPEQLRMIVSLENFNKTHYSSLLNTLLSFYGIWNLDLFRMAYKPFCLHPNMTNTQVLAMDYIVAAYPLLLIVVTYLFVVLYEHGYRLVVWVWSPFHKFFFHFRRQWDIKTSLNEALATFFLLSYVKLLNVSFDLLVPTKLFEQDGRQIRQLYLYYDATVEMFGPEHLPYAITAIIVLSVFVLLPLLLLCLYPLHCFQRGLHYCRLRCFVLHAFIDVFQECYKDGSNKTRDCRCFAGVYLIVRIVLFTIFATTLSVYYYAAAAGVLILTAIVVIIIRPYKCNVYNAVDVILILLLAFGYVSFMGNILATLEDLTFHHMSTMTVVICALLPLVYGITVLLYWILVRMKFARHILRKAFEVLVSKKLRRSDSTEALSNYFNHISIREGYYASLLTERAA